MLAGMILPATLAEIQQRKLEIYPELLVPSGSEYRVSINPHVAGHDRNLHSSRIDHHILREQCLGQKLDEVAIGQGA